MEEQNFEQCHTTIIYQMLHYFLKTEGTFYSSSFYLVQNSVTAGHEVNYPGNLVSYFFHRHNLQGNCSCV